MIRTFTPDSLLMLFTALGVVVAVRLRVWSRQALDGPSRLDPEESLTGLVRVMCIGFLALCLASAVAMHYLGDNLNDPRATIGQTMAQAVTVVVMVVAGKLVRGSQTRGIGWEAKPDRIVQGLRAAIIGCCVALPATVWTNAATEMFLRRFAPNIERIHPLIKAMHENNSPAMRIWVAISAVVTAPLWEELFFRGYLQTALRGFTRRPWLGLLLASAAFAAVHPAWSWPAIFVLALCLGYAYERTGNLWTCILMHAIFNGTELMLSRVSG